MADLTQATQTAVREALPATASACVEAIVREVPGYDRAFDKALRHNIEQAVEQALAAFLDAQENPDAPEAAVAMRQGAYRLGQGEARSGRTTDALLAAYRVGARVAWTRFAESAVAAEESSTAVARLAEETFVFIEELSAQSLAGHTAAVTARTREIARRRDQLAAALAAGEPRAALERMAESAHWKPPVTLTALVIRGEAPSTLVSLVGEQALWVPASSGPSVTLVPGLRASQRSGILDACGAARAALGPSVPWAEASESVRRGHRALRFGSAHVDCEDILPELALDSDPLVAGLLAERALAPLSELSETKRDVLAETLLTWLLHQGRRDDVAQALHVHPQTVRYRMNQLREMYGDQLADARLTLELTLGLVAAGRAPKDDAR